MHNSLSLPAAEIICCFFSEVSFSFTPSCILSVLFYEHFMIVETKKNSLSCCVFITVSTLKRNCRIHNSGAKYSLARVAQSESILIVFTIFFILMENGKQFEKNSYYF